MFPPPILKGKKIILSSFYVYSVSFHHLVGKVKELIFKKYKELTPQKINFVSISTVGDFFSLLIPFAWL